MNQTPSRYDIAAQYVRDTPKLAPYEDIIMYEWPEGEEHWEWVLTAPVAEVLDWVKTLEEDLYSESDDERQAYLLDALSENQQYIGWDQMDELQQFHRNEMS